MEYSYRGNKELEELIKNDRIHDTKRDYLHAKFEMYKAKIAYLGANSFDCSDDFESMRMKEHIIVMIGGEELEFTPKMKEVTVKLIKAGAVFKTFDKVARDHYAKMWSQIRKTFQIGKDEDWTINMETRVIEPTSDKESILDMLNRITGKGD